MSKKEIRSLGSTYNDFTTAQVEARADGQLSGHLFGLGIPYNKWANIGNMFMETIEAGAIDERALKDVCMFTNHETNKIPLARTRNGNGSLKLAIDEKRGILYDTTLDVENNADAKKLCSAVSRGDIIGTSFIMFIDKDRWEFPDGELPKRYIEKISFIQEISPVNYPAYDSTTVAMRSAEAPEDARAVLEKAKTQLLEKRQAEAEALQKAKVAELKAQIKKQYGGKF